MPLKKIFKIHKLRRIQIKRIDDLAGKQELNKFYTDVMKYEQEAMKDKVKNLTGHQHNELDQDFEKHIDKVLKDEKITEKAVITEDYSYNFSVNNWLM